MKFLFIVKQKKNIDTFEGVVAALLRDGHRVTLAIQQRDAERDRRLSDQFDASGFELASCPDARGDSWRSSAPLVRSVRDWAQYFKPPYANASKLRRRAVDRLLREAGGAGDPGAGVLALSPAGARRLHSTLQKIEEAIPSDSLHEEFLAHHQPDVVLVTPGLHFGSGQTDFIKSAQALGIPVWMLLFSWDNLSTKGALHAAPDLMFVWNERQRQEAVELHDFPADRVLVVGAPRFDEFFRLRSVVSRASFFEPLGLDPARPTLLYLCSSRFIAERELDFIGKWLQTLRASGTGIRDCNVLVRPHPDITLVEDRTEPQTVTWPGMPEVTGWVQRPFDDPGAIVLRTTYRTQQAFFECLHHSRAVVALNTSAELEAGIAGRPVFTVLTTDEGSDGQANTLHFNYLLRDHGGFVSYAPDLPAHIEQLSRSLTDPPNSAEIQAFIMQFLRPCGDEPVAELLARTIAQRAAGTAESAQRAGSAVPGDASRAVPHREVAPTERAIETIEGTQKTLQLDTGSAKVFATPETRRWRRKGILSLDPAVVSWLNEHLRPGDAFYDVGSGIGAYAIFAAVQRGGFCVAFEPGFNAFKGLCDNVILNECQRSVVPLPIALGDRTALLELEYSRDAGDDLHALRPREWRSGSDFGQSRYTQPVCAERLDEVVARHGLQPPSVIRVAVRRGAEAVLSGAVGSLQSPSLRSVLVSVKDEAHAQGIVQAIRGTGLGAVVGAMNGDHGIAVVLTRSGAARGSTAPMDAFRRAADRLRRMW